MDLNLLVSLDALLQERSVTRAAQRLGLSQPTLSTALARLRRHFDDELLVRAGNSYQLTPLAERLAESTPQALSWTDRVFKTRPDFDPSWAEHEFTLVVSDGHLPTFCRSLLDLVREEAPGVRLRFRHTTHDFVHRAHEYLRTVDAAVLPQGLLADLPTLDLYPDHWVCVVSADNPVARAGSVSELAGHPWVVPFYDSTVLFSPLHRLRDLGVETRVETTTENFLAVPHLIAGTDRLGLVPARVARRFPPVAGTPVVEVPFDLGVLVESLWWHPMHNRDPAHSWLRQLAARAGREVAEQDALPATTGGHRRSHDGARPG